MFLINLPGIGFSGLGNRDNSRTTLLATYLRVTFFGRPNHLPASYELYSGFLKPSDALKQVSRRP